MYQANMARQQSLPKRLRHSYSAEAMKRNILLTVAGNWAAQSSIKATTIYASVVAAEERELSEKMSCVDS
jgi:integrase/recombinase XerD